MADEPFVDTHIHFWDKSVDRSASGPGSSRAISFRKWTFDPAIDAPRYGPRSSAPRRPGCDVVGAVHVHCADPIPIPADRDGVDRHARCGHAVGRRRIVGACDLDAADAADDDPRRGARSPLFRGVRDPFSAKRLDATTRGAGDGHARRRSERRSRCDAITTTSRVVDELAARWPTVTDPAEPRLPAARSHARPVRGVERGDPIAGPAPQRRLQDLDGRRSVTTRADASTACARGCWPASRRSAPTAACSRSNFPIDRPYCSYAAADRRSIGSRWPS